MISPTDVLIGFSIVLFLMFLGVHVATAMMSAAVMGALLFLGPALLLSFGTQLWATTNDSILTAIPLFVLLGELLLRSGLTGRMYDGLADWMTKLPGGLMHTNIAASGMFAAVSGSSVATAATIGTVALPEFKARGYNEKLVLGSIAAGGTLGILIPPSINMIIYGAIANASIGKLFAAGFVPGLLLVGLFMAAIALACWINPSLAGRPAAPVSFKEKVRKLRHLGPPFVIFSVVMGAIYGGWATPTEAAAVGVVLALFFTALYGTLGFEMLHEAFRATVKTSAMILLIIATAFFLNFILGVLGVPQALTGFVASMGTTAIIFIWLLVPMYFLLGCFLETIAMMVATVPIILPLLEHFGIDTVWFGIFLVLMMELSLITPPVGMNLYVVQGVRGGGSVTDVFYGVIPFISALLLMVVLVIVFPGIVMFVPDLLYP